MNKYFKSVEQSTRVWRNLAGHVTPIWPQCANALQTFQTAYADGSCAVAAVDGGCTGYAACAYGFAGIGCPYMFCAGGCVGAYGLAATGGSTAPPYGYDTAGGCM